MKKNEWTTGSKHKLDVASKQKEFTKSCGDFIKSKLNIFTQSSVDIFCLALVGFCFVEIVLKWKMTCVLLPCSRCVRMAIGN